MKLNRFFQLALFLSAITFFNQAQAQVWVDQNSWSDQFEQKYSDWVENSWSTDFFSRKTLSKGQANPYYGLRVDCADTVYSMRIIFAFENQLPFAINDPTGGSKVISNRMSRFDSSRTEIERLRKFLVFIYGVGSTRSLPQDTYPIAINSRTVRPGTLILTTTTNHHSWTVKSILPIGVPWLVYNSVAGASSGLDLKQRQSWPHAAWVFEGKFSAAGNAGFRDWKPISMVQMPAWKIPGYSEEQYQVPINSWASWAQKKLAIQIENPEQNIQRLFRTACEGLSSRVEAVSEGINYLNRNPQCMNAATFENYSTPNRDQRLFDDLVALRLSFQNMILEKKAQELNDETFDKMRRLFPYPERDLKSELQLSTINDLQVDLCPVQYRSGMNIDLLETKRRISLGLFSTNPMDAIEYRWGEKSGASALSRRCQAWEIWAPRLDEDIN